MVSTTQTLSSIDPRLMITPSTSRPLKTRNQKIPVPNTQIDNPNEDLRLAYNNLSKRAKILTLHKDKSIEVVKFRRFKRST